MNIDKRLISAGSDIKPENILLDAHGHVHLTDLCAVGVPSNGSPH